MRKIALSVTLLAVCPLLAALQPQSAPPAQQAPSGPSEKPRVFVTDSQSWETGGSGAAAGGVGAAQSHGGARPQTAEIIKTFGQRCPQVIVNNKQEVADYIVVLDHEGGKGAFQHKNKVAVFDHLSGDVVISKSTLSLGGSVEDACNGIVAHWGAHGNEMLAARAKPLAPPTATPVPAAAASAPPPTIVQASLSVDSAPPGADIEIDGAFVGDTPSNVTVAPGSHQVTVKKKGFTDWTKTLNVTGGTIHLNAELEQEPPKQ